MGSKNLTYYDNYQEMYTRPPGYFVPIVSELLPLLKDKPGTQILDIGCGFGDFLAAFNQQLNTQCFYSGLTIARHEYDSIKKQFPFINISLGRQQDLKKIYGAMPRFDLIINFHTLSYLRQFEQLNVIRQMTALLKPQGLLLLGLMDTWIKITSKIRQADTGYVQFYYSPFIFPALSRDCSLLLSSIEPRHNYRIQIWKKGQGELRVGFALAWEYIKKTIFKSNLSLTIFSQIL